jgi:unspecific monooxygenase
MAGTDAPGPRGKPFVGDIVAYQADRIGWLTTSRDRYGDVVRLAPKIIVVSDAELAHQVLAATDGRYTVDATLRSGAGERRALEEYLTNWMRVRREVWKSLADRLNQLHVTRFAAHLSAELGGRAGDQGDVLATVRRLLGRAIVDFCVGAEPDRAALDTVYGAADELFQTALQALVGGEGRARWTRRPAARAAVEANNRLLELLGRLVAERQRRPRRSEPDDLLDALLDRSEQTPVRETVSVLRTILFASHGVPGTAAAWIALLLAEHPAAAATIAQEAAGMTPAGTGVTDALPYTTAVVREALRLYPPQWLLTRTASLPTEIGGYRVPAGTEVLMCPYLMHRDPRWWEHPERFDPSRWLQREQPHARHAYLPFGAGPRVCPGAHLAMAHLTMLTALLARDYRLRLPRLADVPVSSEGLLAPEGLSGGWDAAHHTMAATKQCEHTDALSNESGR